MELMTSGAFARASRLSRKALRLYDELGLLRPVQVDPVSQYRFYAAAQLEQARLVAWLRRLEANGQEPAYAFINRLTGTADEASTLKALCQQLLPEEDRVLEISGDPAGLRARFGELVRSPPTGEPFASASAIAR